MKLLMLSLSLVVLTYSLQATTYYFSTSGNDANNGLSPDSPKVSMPQAVARMTSGNTVLFKRGDIWYVPMYTIDLSGRSNVNIGAYGTGARPVIAGLAQLPTWTHYGSGIWSCNTNSLTADGYLFAHRVFVNGISKINLEVKKGNSNNIGSLDSTDEFYMDVSARTLYLYTGSTSVGPQNVTIVPGKSGVGNTGGKVLVQISNSAHHINFKNIDLRGGSKSNVIAINAPGWNVTIDSCNIGWAGTSGIFAGNPVVNGDLFSDIVITNCIIDKGWTQGENNIDDDTTLAGDGIFLAHAIEAGLIKDNTILNWGHSAIQVSSYLSSTMYGVHRVIIDHNDISAGNSGYMHAIDISGLANRSTNHIVKRNFLNAFTSTCHFGGRNNFYFSNIIAFVTVTPIYKHSHQPMGADLYPWSVPAGNLEARDNYIFNNTFYNTDAYSLYMGQSNGDSTSASNNYIINNIMMNYGFDTTYDPKPATAQPYNIALSIHPNIKGNIYVRNNNFWKSSAPTGKIARYKTTTILRTAAELNTAPECNGLCSDNTQLAPVFGYEWDLTSSSPTQLKTGGKPYNEFLPAFFLADREAELVDYSGAPLRLVNPSRGARQY